MSNISVRKQEVNSVFENKETLEKLKAYLKTDDQKEKFKQTVIMLSLSQNLQKFSVHNIAKCAIQSLQIGLDILPQKALVYFTPRWDNKIKQSVLELSIGYKGYQKLLLESGQSIKTHAVYNCDQFSMSIDGFNENVTFVPDYSQHKESDYKWIEANLKGILVMIKDQATKEVYVNFVPKDKLMQLRGASEAIKKERFSPWTEYAKEMFMAKAIKYVISKRPMSDNVSQAVEIENQNEIANKEPFVKKLHALEAVIEPDQIPAIEPEDESQLTIDDDLIDAQEGKEYVF